jgi:hypothetical protein
MEPDAVRREIMALLNAPPAAASHDGEDNGATARRGGATIPPSAASPVGGEPRAKATKKK